MSLERSSCCCCCLEEILKAAPGIDIWSPDLDCEARAEMWISGVAEQLQCQHEIGRTMGYFRPGIEIVEMGSGGEAELINSSKQFQAVAKAVNMHATAVVFVRDYVIGSALLPSPHTSPFPIDRALDNHPFGQPRGQYLHRLVADLEHHVLERHVPGA